MIWRRAALQFSKLHWWDDLNGEKERNVLSYHCHEGQSQIMKETCQVHKIGSVNRITPSKK